MDREDLDRHLSQGEGLTTEFKRCGNQPSDDTYESICSFANRQGGNIFLGVDDGGNVIGVPEGRALAIGRTVANAANNPKLFEPIPAVEVENIPYDDETVVRVWVPLGESVYRYKGVVYDRVADADVRIAGSEQIASLYLRKQNRYTERKVYPYLLRSDLRDDLIDRARKMATIKNPQHPWGAMDNDELLRSARLYGMDRQTGEQGYTLAAAMLFGTDEAIGDICPAYKTDAVVRIHDKDRYDDRLVTTTNLFDAYDQLSTFVRRNTPDRFYLEGAVNVSPRDILVRELIVNCLIHREFTSPFPAKVVIDSLGIRTENASRSLFEGRLTLEDFNPIPKNPTIAHVFAQAGLAEELGSGLRNLTRYSLAYSGGEPVLKDGDVFKAFVPVERAATRVSPGEEACGHRPESFTAAEYAGAKGISLRTAQRLLKEAADRGTLTVTRDGRSYLYTPVGVQSAW